jgi:hypothetical protein
MSYLVNFLDVGRHELFCDQLYEFQGPLVEGHHEVSAQFADFLVMHQKIPPTSR